MKKLIISLIVTVVALGAFAEQTQEQKLNRQIAILESKVFKLETENKNLKAELEKKDKAINSLAIKLAQKTASTTTKTKRTSYSSSRQSRTQNNYAEMEAKRKAAESARQRKIIDEKIKYYEAQKPELEKELKEAERQYKDASQTIGKTRRARAIMDAKRNLNNAKQRVSAVESAIEQLKLSKMNYM